MNIEMKLKRLRIKQVLFEIVVLISIREYRGFFLHVNICHLHRKTHDFHLHCHLTEMSGKEICSVF